MTQSASASDSADQHLVEYDVERRVQLTFAVSPEQAKKLLPASWQVASMPPGPSEGANFMVAFRNRLLTVHYNADGEARVGEQDRGAILLVFTKNTENGEFAFRVVRSFSANAHAIPGPYKNAQFAAVDMEQGMTAQETSDSSGFERWQIRDDAGGTLRLLLRYRAGAPLQSGGEMTIFGGPDPAFFRVYRTDKASDFVKSTPNKVDRIDEFQFDSTIAEFSNIFDGTQRVISIWTEPWYLRHVLLQNPRP